MPVDIIHREPGPAFTSKTLDDFGVGGARSGGTTNPVVDRGGADIELLREPFGAVGPNEACEFGFPTSHDGLAHRPPLYLCGKLSYGAARIGARGPQIPDLLTHHSEETAVRAASNLSISRKKSSPIIRKSDRAVLKSKCVITNRELAEVLSLRGELRSLVDRFDKKLWQIEHRGCRR
jgi:hypothetical protein